MTALDTPPVQRRAPLAQGRGDGVGRLARRTQRGQGWRRVLVLALVALSVALGVTSSVLTATMVETDVTSTLTDRIGPGDLLLEDAANSDPFVDPPLDEAQLAWLAERGVDGIVGGQDEEVAEVAVTLEEAVALLPPGSGTLTYSHNGLFGYRDSRELVTDLDVTDPLAGTTIDAGDRTAPLTGTEALASPSWLEQRDLRVGAVVDVGGVGEVEVVGTATRAIARSQPLLVVAPGRSIELGGQTSAVRVDLPDGAAGPTLAGELRNQFEATQAEIDTSRPGIWAAAPDVLTPEEVQSLNEDPLAVSTLVGIVTTGFAVTVAALLAACAFAVGVRRRLRELGMLGAVGADPGQLARLVRREGLVIGSLGALLGAGLGIGFSLLAHPVLERALDTDIALRLPLVVVLPPVLLGALGAMLAAWWPARTAARVPVVAALAGRVPTARVPVWLPVASGLVAAAGVALFAFAWSMDGVVSGTGRALPVLGVSIVATLGAAGLGLPLLSLGGRVADRLPVRARLALRDAARRRARSGAAVAALVPVLALPVAAVVVGTADNTAAFEGGYVEPEPTPFVAVFGPGVEGLQPPPPAATTAAVAARLPVDGRRADLVLLGPAPDRGPDQLGPGWPAVHVAWSAVTDPADGDLPAGEFAFVELPAAPVALATPEALDLLGLPAGAVGDGEVLVLQRGLTSPPPADGQQVTVTPEPYVDPGDPDGVTSLGTLRAVVRGGVDAIPGAPALVTAATASELGLVEVGRPVVLGLERPPTRTEHSQLWPVTETSGGFVNANAQTPFWDTAAGRLVVGGLVGLAVLAVVAVVAGMAAALAATESDDDLRRAVALGATPATRRVFHGIQAWWHAAIAGVLGSVLGSVIGLVVIGDVWRTPDPRVWFAVVGWTLLAPVVIGGVIALCMRSSSVEAPRRRMA